MIATACDESSLDEGLAYTGRGSDIYQRRTRRQQSGGANYDYREVAAASPVRGSTTTRTCTGWSRSTRRARRPC